MVTSEPITEELTVKGQHEEIFLVDGTTHHLNCGGSFMAACIYENSEICTKKVGFHYVYLKKKKWGEHFEFY